MRLPTATKNSTANTSRNGSSRLAGGGRDRPLRDREPADERGEGKWDAENTVADRCEAQSRGDGEQEEEVGLSLDVMHDQGQRARPPRSPHRRTRRSACRLSHARSVLQARAPPASQPPAPTPVTSWTTLQPSRACRGRPRWSTRRRLRVMLTTTTLEESATARPRMIAPCQASPERRAASVEIAATATVWNGTTQSSRRRSRRSSRGRPRSPPRTAAAPRRYRRRAAARAGLPRSPGVNGDTSSPTSMYPTTAGRPIRRSMRPPQAAAMSTMPISRIAGALASTASSVPERVRIGR